MTTELIVIIIIVAVLAPFLFMNSRKNRKRFNDRRNREFMGDYIDKKKGKKRE